MLEAAKKHAQNSDVGALSFAQSPPSRLLGGQTKSKAKLKTIQETLLSQFYGVSHLKFNPHFCLSFPTTFNGLLSMASSGGLGERKAHKHHSSTEGNYPGLIELAGRYLFPS